MYLLDTNHLSVLQRRGPSQEFLQARLERVPTEQVCTAIVCLEEEFRGWMAYLASLRSVEAHVPAYSRLQNLLANFASLNVLLSIQQHSTFSRNSGYTEYESAPWT